MQNQDNAVSRRLSDPDFQAKLVTRCIGLAMGCVALVGVSLVHDAYVWMNPPQPKYFRIDGRTPPQPLVALDSPIVDDEGDENQFVGGLLVNYSF